MNKESTAKSKGRKRGVTSSRAKSLATRIRRIRCVLTDVDGVLTDGKLHFTSNGDEFKSFDIQDGHGIAMAKRAGLIIGFVSGRLSKVTEKRAAELGVDIVMQGPTNKMEMVEQIKAAHGLENDEFCFIGDDLVDLPVLRRAGLAVAVPNAMDEVKQVAHYVTKRPGGHGAVREVLEMIMKAQGSWTAVIAKYMVALLIFCAGVSAFGVADVRGQEGRQSKKKQTPDNVQTTGYIEKFEVPEVDENGNLKWKLYGEKARLRADGMMDIYNMRAEFFEGGKVGLVFTTEECLLDRVNKKATTDAPVRIERENMVLTGTGGEWDGPAGLFVVHHDVRMELRTQSAIFEKKKPSESNETKKEP